MGTLLRAPEPPTALFTALNRMTVGAVRAMYTVGHQLEIAQFGDFELADLLGCPITMAVNDRQQMANVAVQLLLERINGSHVPPRHIRIPTRLERREPLRTALPAGFQHRSPTLDVRQR
jgi:LacI family transcriptional regulator